VIGLLLAPLGGWLALNGGGTCLALRFTDFCLIGGQLFGTIFGLFGLLSLLAGLDAYRQGDKYV